ncbi:MAG: hypothetical protein KIG76_07645 [Eubacteriales bacterium]|nr:hypothetical protein [Candidatus Colimorpha enterica]
MGHSGKAGENIFWAMNRNKPGIIKRILNALERFIARIRGKDAYLAVEQRQAAERLRDMLTGELKRAYGTDVKGEAAVESDGGKRHSLAGANSRTADLNSLGGAYQMYQNGVSMDTIRKRTGWWLGKDGKWRYEISDKEMRFNPEGYVDNPQTVGDYVKHDRLFAAYPWIMDVNVLMSENVAGDPNSLGRYVPSENFIELKTGVPTEKTKHVLIHELQHAIQNKEHFTNGTNSTVTSRYIVNLAYNNVKNNPEFKAEKSPRGKMDYIIGYLEARMDANFDDIAKYYYSRNHGEIEAQYVDKRLDMSDNARKAEPIVNYGDVYTREDVRADFIDNLKEMGYNEEQVNEILEKGIPYDNKHQNEQESLGQTGEGRKNLAGEAGRLPRQGTQRGERREVYRTGKVQVADSVKKTGQVDSLSDSTIFRRGRTDSETGRNGIREAPKRLNELSKPEKRFSLSSADTDIYSRIFDMQREETELTNRIREIEKSDAFKKANDDLSKAINNDNIAEGMKAYQAWSKESGYADLVDRRDALRAELEEIRTKANNDAVSKAINEERTAIEKSGLSEADYFRKQAVKEFGYTPYFYDAGYIMPNGKMLNFSGEKGRHYGSRGQDHRAIGTIYADTEGTDALVRFMNDGNIRIMAETPGLDISASTEPSKEQYTTIRRFANEFSDGGYFAVDLSDENGKTVGTLEYEGNINPTRIVNDIKHFYETGEVREQSGLDRFRYSLARANDEYMKAVESGNVEEQQRLVDEAAENAGYDSPKVFHQTGERFWEFKTDNPVAGAYDSETPNGIFFKSNDHDIGVGGNYVETGRGGEIQMAAYLRMENTLHFSDRKEANAWYVKNVPGYEAAQTEMQKAVEPFDRQIDALDDEFFVNDSISEEEYDRQWNNLIEKLRETENKYRKRLREILDDYFLTGNSGYDSIELDYDGHRYIDGKRENVHTYIVFDGSQVKSADPITYDDSGNVIPLTERFDSGNRDIRWSLAGKYDYSKSFADQIDDYKNGLLPVYDTFVVSETPKVWQDIGFNALPVTLNQTHVDYALNGTKDADHEISEADLKKLPEKIKEPIAIIQSQSNPSRAVVFIEMTSKNGKNVVTPVEVDGYGKTNNLRIDSNALASVFGKKNAANQLQTAIDNTVNGKTELFYWDKKRSLALLQGAGLQLPSGLPQDGFVHSIREPGSLVKAKMDDVTNSLQFKRWFGDWKGGKRNVSKVVNRDGSPRVVYHYTDADFEAFDTSKSGSNQGVTHGDGIYVSTNPTEFAYAGKNRLDLYASIKKPFEMQLTKSQAERVYDKYFAPYHDDKYKTYRPHVIEKLQSGSRVFDYLSEAADNGGVRTSDILKELGYDGVHDGSEWVAFDSTQLKSATDNIGTFDKDNPKLKYSLAKSTQSELKALQKENEKLRQDVDDLKQELQLTRGRKLSRDALISSIQKILIDGYGVKLSAKELYPHVTNLYDMFYNNTVDGKRLKKDERVDTMRIIEEMDKIVDAVIENAVGVDDTYVEMKKLIPELRNTKLVVPMDARADAAQSAGFENWAEFRKANFGRVGFANEGLPVDTYYMELSERYPELFPDGITNPGEQAAHIADVVNTIRESGINEYQLYDIEDERIRTSIKNDVMDIIGNAEKLQTFADRAAQKVEDTKLAEAMHYGADIAKLKRLNAEKVADIKAENRKRLSDMRRKYQDRVESVRERYAEARANRSEKQKQTVLRNKVLRKYTEASSMLDRPTTENHFTEAMRKPLMEFLAAVDITTGKSVAKQGVYDRILRVIEAANNMAAEGGKNGLDIAETDLNVQEKQLIVDSGLLERMSAWVEANKGKRLTELSSAQLFDQIVSNEPPVGYVHLDLLQQPYFAADTVRISYEQHTEKNLRLDSRASVILAVIRLADSAGTSSSNTILSQA